MYKKNVQIVSFNTINNSLNNSSFAAKWDTQIFFRFVLDFGIIAKKTGDLCKTDSLYGNGNTQSKI